MKNIPKVGDYLIFTGDGGSLFDSKIPFNTPIKLIKINGKFEGDGDVNGEFENGNKIRLYSGGFQKGVYEQYYTIQSLEPNYEIY